MTDGDGKGVEDLANTVARESGAEPGAPMDVSDESCGLSSGENQQEKPHHLDWSDSQSAEVVDIRGASNAKSDRKTGDKWVIGEIP